MHAMMVKYFFHTLCVQYKCLSIFLKLGNYASTQGACNMDRTCAYLDLVIPFVVTHACSLGARPWLVKGLAPRLTCMVECGLMSTNYTVCGSLSPAPSLTVENIVKEVEGARNVDQLQRWLSGDVYTPTPSIMDIMEDFLKGYSYYQPSWRAIIFTLDGAEETHYANRIRHYAEPVPGRYICVIKYKVGWPRTQALFDGGKRHMYPLSAHVPNIPRNQKFGITILTLPDDYLPHFWSLQTTIFIRSHTLINNCPQVV